jgi:hypothetical protein
MDQMNDLEDLVRQELRAHVDAAEARQADEPPSVLLGALDRRIRRARLRRRWTASALSAGVIAAAITLPLALLSPGTRPLPSMALQPASVPLSDTAATPRGWAPVAFGNVQISVPPDWLVGYRPVCGRVGRGYVVLGTAATSLKVRNPRCKQASNMAAIQVLQAGQGQTHGQAGEINGIHVLPAPPVVHGDISLYVPALDALVTARGPLANKVVGTLTRSASSVVLMDGPHFPVPNHWRWHDFGGIRFATPAPWRTIKSRIWYPCWWVISSTDAVKLINATRTARFICPPPPFMADAMRPRHGVVVGVGRYMTLHRPPGHRCRSLHGLRACFAMPGPGSPLALAVYVPGRHKPTVVEIGLAGNGLEARTIFESIQPR